MLVVVVEGSEVVVSERRGSGRPGAEGAPLERCDGLVVEVLVVRVGWDEGGAIRSD